MSWNERSRPQKFLIVFGSAAITFLLGLILVNFTLGEKKLSRDIPHLYGLHDEQFMRTMGVMLGPTIVRGNRIKELMNGDEIFPAMLADIRNARQTIDLETYIYWSGNIGKQFSDALSERARAGVKVHVLVDWVGSQRMADSQMEAMRRAGVRIYQYKPLHWYNLGSFNNRTHRKLLIVDGHIGYTGGVGIADKWSGHAQDQNHWRDSQYRVEGPVVAQMQAVFTDNWTETTGKVLHGPLYFPHIDDAGTTDAQMFSSSPSGGSESMQLMYLLSISAAEKSIYLSSSYFLPDKLTRDALISAVRRGVKVQIVTQGKNTDTEAVRRASRGEWKELLEAGVEIYEYEPTLYHCKVMIVDELLTSVGSTNFDERSFRLNDEANLNVYDPLFAQRQIEIFRRDLEVSKRITLEQWQRRPLHEKLLEKALSLAAPLL